MYSTYDALSNETNDSMTLALTFMLKIAFILFYCYFLDFHATF